jgi:IS4 transposase
MSLVPVYFVVRAKRNLSYKRGTRRSVDKTTGLRSDVTIRLIGPKTARPYPQPLRRVHYWDPDTGKDLVFLSNNFRLPALTIAQIYRERWAVELFFKWIKQHLHIQAFYGTSPNAVKTQIYTGITTYLLVAQVKKLLHQTHSPYILLLMLGLHLDEKVPLEQLLTRLNFQIDIHQVSNQLYLFD